MSIELDQAAPDKGDRRSGGAAQEEEWKDRTGQDRCGSAAAKEPDFELQPALNPGESTE